MTHTADSDAPRDWLTEEYERAKARLASLPKWARPVVTGKAFDRDDTDEPKRFVCRCGHPGMGCYCP